MTARRRILWSCLVAYLAQVAFAIYSFVWPVEVKALTGAPVTATMMKEFESIDFVPLVGILSIFNPQGYRLIIGNGHDSRTILLDLGSDLPVGSLFANREASRVVVFDDRSGRRVAELAAAPSVR